MQETRLTPISCCKVFFSNFFPKVDDLLIYVLIKEPFQRNFSMTSQRKNIQELRTDCSRIPFFHFWSTGNIELTQCFIKLLSSISNVTGPQTQKKIDRLTM